MAWCRSRAIVGRERRPRRHHRTVDSKFQSIASAARRYSSSIAPSTSNESAIPPTVIAAFAGSGSRPLSRPLDTASRTAFSISRCAVTPSFLRNLRTLVFSTSSFMFLLTMAVCRARGTGLESDTSEHVRARRAMLPGFRQRSAGDAQANSRPCNFPLAHLQGVGNFAFGEASSIVALDQQGDGASPFHALRPGERLVQVGKFLEQPAVLVQRRDRFRAGCSRKYPICHVDPRGLMRRRVAPRGRRSRWPLRLG